MGAAPSAPEFRPKHVSIQWKCVLCGRGNKFPLYGNVFLRPILSRTNSLSLCCTCGMGCLPERAARRSAPIGVPCAPRNCPAHGTPMGFMRMLLCTPGSPCGQPGATDLQPLWGCGGASRPWRAAPLSCVPFRSSRVSAPLTPDS